MSTFFKAAVVAIALGAGAVSAQAGAGYNDLISSGQVVHPNGTAGSK
ncbi:MAG: hypothetical protein ACRBCJ_07420 [Hyphomicrobiaceae bacterium]